MVLSNETGSTVCDVSGIPALANKFDLFGAALTVPNRSYIRIPDGFVLTTVVAVDESDFDDATNTWLFFEAGGRVCNSGISAKYLNQAIMLLSRTYYGVLGGCFRPCATLTFLDLRSTEFLILHPRCSGGMLVGRLLNPMGEDYEEAVR